MEQQNKHFTDSSSSFFFPPPFFTLHIHVAVPGARSCNNSPSPHWRGDPAVMYCEKASSSLCCRLSEGAWQHCSLAFEKLLWNEVKVSFSLLVPPLPKMSPFKVELSPLRRIKGAFSLSHKDVPITSQRVKNLSPKICPFLSKRTCLKGLWIDSVPSQHFYFSFQTQAGVFLQPVTGSVALLLDEDLPCTWK